MTATETRALTWGDLRTSPDGALPTWLLSSADLLARMAEKMTLSEGPARPPCPFCSQLCPSKEAFVDHLAGVHRVLEDSPIWAQTTVRQVEEWLAAPPEEVLPVLEPDDPTAPYEVVLTGVPQRLALTRQTWGRTRVKVETKSKGAILLGRSGWALDLPPCVGSWADDLDGLWRELWGRTEDGKPATVTVTMSPRGRG